MPNHPMPRRRPLFAAPEPPPAGRSLYRTVMDGLIRVFRWASMAVGGLVLVSFAIGFAVSSFAPSETHAPLPSAMVLHLDFMDGIYEMPPDAGFIDPSSGGYLTIQNTVDAIDRAVRDPRVKGLVASMDGAGLEVSHVQELRAALERFHKAGKFTYAYATSLGEGYGDLSRYYMASAFDEIWMQPLGVVSIPGIRAETPFGRDVLDKLGVEPQFFQRREYKTAYESFNRSQMSPANREMMTSLVGSIRSQIVHDVASDLKITPQAFEQQIDRGLYTSPEAIDAKLITHANYDDHLSEVIKKRVTGDPYVDDTLYVDLDYYRMRTDGEQSQTALLRRGFNWKNQTVAIIYATGAIVESRVGAKASAGVFMDETIVAADEIAPAIREAADDDGIAAIVLRIDSPGGSPAASESILRALDRAQEMGKPVVVSMGPMAASGGYWIAAHADRIFATPSTLTGSIGVLGGKVSMKELWKKIGVNWDMSVQWGQNSGLWSSNTPFSAGEAERINAMLDHVYESFLTRVSEGRNMKRADVEKIAGGRVWTGAQAVKNGLADEIGGLANALDYTAGLVGAKSRDDIAVVQLPRPRTKLEKLMELLEDTSSNAAAMTKMQKAFTSRAAPMIRALQPALNGEVLTTYEPVRIY